MQAGGGPGVWLRFRIDPQPEFGYLRSEYVTIVISWLFKIWTQMTLKVESFQRTLERKLVEIWKK